MDYIREETQSISEDVRISDSVWTQIVLKGSSGCSAIAMRARMTGSDRGTMLVVTAAEESGRTAPTSTIVRISLITCSFSTACLLSRSSDLDVDINSSLLIEKVGVSYFTIYQSRA
jgi:hypothetical protein